ncbi:proline-rich protein HaeIII subfamily 1-like [Uranotaenia lowii]|uniref:proline-rich protein HaeIII subfamily 1-like n=1 Tax=Uranotaenia lowii TaxID=190385 RepID=UPI0024797898|nr:proline-rich protein HaeIII subfamily 1-like [Uranotaenia lowii]
MKVFVTILAAVATVGAQGVPPVNPGGQVPAPVDFPQQFAPIQPLTTPFNVAPDGFYGFNPYSGPGFVPGFPQFAQPGFNQFLPLPYQFPQQFGPPPAAYPQFPLIPQIPQVPPQLAPAQLPPFAQPPQIPPFLDQRLLQPGNPQPNGAAVSYSSFQVHNNTPQQQQQQQSQTDDSASAAPAQGVNGLPKPVTTSTGNDNQAPSNYGSAFGRYVTASPPAGVGPGRVATNAQ